jgi:Bacterial TniB protein
MAGVTHTPLLLLRAPPAPDERHFYLHILAAVGAPATAIAVRSQNAASLEGRVIALLRDLGLRMIMIDEVHNLLAGTHREQRRFLNVLCYLSNELEVSFVCFGVSEAVDAIRGDVQLARRLDEHHLPNWRADFELVQSLTISAVTPLEAEMTAQFSFQKCPICSVHGVALKHWRQVWSFDCLMCGTQLIPNMPRPGMVSPSTKTLRRARIGARLLEGAVKHNNARQIHRAMRGVAFAVAVTRYHDGSSIAALQGFNPEVRITCLAAIYAVQQKLLLKAARIRAKVDDFAKASLLKAYSKQPHLLAAVRGIADRRSQGVSSADIARFTAQGAPDSHNSSQRNGQNTGQREDSRS